MHLGMAAQTGSPSEHQGGGDIEGSVVHPLAHGVDREQQFPCYRRSSVEVEVQQQSRRPLVDMGGKPRFLNRRGYNGGGVGQEP
jgi:hypothetical protein